MEERDVTSVYERLEHKLELHDGKLTTHDDAIAAVLSAIRELMTPPEPPKKRRIGFIEVALGDTEREQRPDQKVEGHGGAAGLHLGDAELAGEMGSFFNRFRSRFLLQRPRRRARG